MTAIKQVSVTNAKHAKNLGGYLNDERALLRDSQNISNQARWESEMEKTRAAYGHDRPSRAGAANTVMYHQVIAFNPDECSCNGGKMTPEMCMDFAKEWVSERYPNQEAIWVLHVEKCKADRTSRYAIHVGINRTDLETGRRLDEGRSKGAKVARANAMRKMDEKWGLRQMVKGQRNSRAHAMQPTKAEKEMRARGVTPDKDFIRARVRHHAQAIAASSSVSNPMRELAQRLERDGIRMTRSKDGKGLKFQKEGTKREISGHRLGRGYSAQGLAKGMMRSFESSLEFEAKRDC